MLSFSSPLSLDLDLGLAERGGTSDSLLLFLFETTISRTTHEQLRLAFPASFFLHSHKPFDPQVHCLTSLSPVTSPGREKKDADCDPDLTLSLFTHRADYRRGDCNLGSLCSRCINEVIRD